MRSFIFFLINRKNNFIIPKGLIRSSLVEKNADSILSQIEFLFFFFHR